MTQPMDPNDMADGPTEYSWGPGLFPPGVANNEAQANPQEDFGSPYKEMGLAAVEPGDGYAKAVADRRTDATDPESKRDFDVLGNVDRYGPNPPLVRAQPQPNTSEVVPPNVPETPRAW